MNQSPRVWWLLALVLLLPGCDTTQTSGEDMLERGLGYLEAGDQERAIAALTESLRLRPNNPDAHYNRGLAHVGLGNFAAAREDYTQAIRLRPDFAEAYTNRAVTFAHDGQLDEAIADCTQALELNPQDALAFRNRGLAQHEPLSVGVGITKQPPDSLEQIAG